SGMAMHLGKTLIMALLFLGHTPMYVSAQLNHRDTVVFLRAKHPEDPSKKREHLEFHTKDTTFTWLKGIPSRFGGDKIVSGRFSIRGETVLLYASDHSVHRRFRISSRFIGGVPDQLMYE